MRGTQRVVEVINEVYFLFGASEWVTIGDRLESAWKVLFRKQKTRMHMLLYRDHDLVLFPKQVANKQTCLFSDGLGFLWRANESFRPALQTFCVLS